MRITKLTTLCVTTLCLAAILGNNAIAAEDMAGMNMGGADAPKMQGGSAPANARDPHAYSGGYDFGPIPRPVMADEAIMTGVMINRLERAQTKENTYLSAYDLQGRIGKDYERLVLKAEGVIDEGKVHEARTELLWSHATSAYWDGQLGVRHDSGVAPGRNWIAVGMQGLAPYWIEIDATAYVGDQGRSTLRLYGMSMGEDRGVGARCICGT